MSKLIGQYWDDLQLRAIRSGDDDINIEVSIDSSAPVAPIVLNVPPGYELVLRADGKMIAVLCRRSAW